MILSREDLQELYANGSLEVVMSTVPADDLQSVQPGVAKPAVCQVRVVDQWTHRTGDYVVVVELVKRMKQAPHRLRVVRERPRLMKKGRGTTHDPRAAMRNPSVGRSDDDQPPGLPYPDLNDSEPEMVDEETEQRFARAARKHSELREAERQRRGLTERLDRALEACERLGVDPTRHIAAIERRISDLEKRQKKAA